MTLLAGRAVRPLAAQIEALLAASVLYISKEQRSVIDRQTLLLVDAAGAAISTGEIASDFILPNQYGEIVRLKDRLLSGPVALVFFRGPWCPYCAATLQAWEQQQAALRRVGASLLAISPQTPSANLQTAKDNGLSFDLLSDLGCDIASSLRIAFQIDMGIRGFYLQSGISLLEVNGGDAEHLPMPSTFLLDTSGTIRLADVHGDPTHRLDPVQAVAALRRIKRPRLNA